MFPSFVELTFGAVDAVLAFVFGLVLGERAGLKEVPSRDALLEIRINRPQTAHGGHCCGSGLFIDPLGHPRASLGQKVKISYFILGSAFFPRG